MSPENNLYQSHSIFHVFRSYTTRQAVGYCKNYEPSSGLWKIVLKLIVSVLEYRNLPIGAVGSADSVYLTYDFCSPNCQHLHRDMSQRRPHENSSLDGKLREQPIPGADGTLASLVLLLKH
jgi:hypothetical protein